MSKKMLIDASHPEETRVVVVDGNRVADFDYEAASKRQLRGNIYLARVTRVEPSLQAAFVEYGGNRHGFLAFNEIHPDYYQIPHEDRQELLEQERAVIEGAAKKAAAKSKRRSSRKKKTEDDAAAAEAIVDAAVIEDAEVAAPEADAAPDPEPDAQTEPADGEATADGVEALTAHLDEAELPDTPPAPPEEVAEQAADMSPAADDDPAGAAAKENDPKEDDDDPKSVAMAVEVDAPTLDAPAAEPDEDDDLDDEDDADAAETAPDLDDDEDDDDKPRGDGDDDDEVMSEIARLRRRFMRKYKIQEVIKRRQILLVQVVKEERGNKGAALTTYLSLAGRYCVLMPNTARGGGISRKITAASDRKRLKEVVSDLSVPEGLGLIVRTAGAKRTKTEIKRDYEYLVRLWETIRGQTLESVAPCMIHEESNLVKRAIRDLYDKDIDEVLVEGESAYKEAKSFMRMLMPSHAKKVQPHKENTPLFLHHGVEDQLQRIYDPVVNLKSGGYLVINQTEALVAVDVNSGRATKERNIEATALKTNLEAADEACRQMRLRDLAGLLVIDFIDMDEAKNNRAVEKRMRDALKSDRARVQHSKISQFGLMELSRQRRRANLLDSSHVTCPHCSGLGLVRGVESSALSVMRRIEAEALKRTVASLRVVCPREVALYLLNEKREGLAATEERFGMSLDIAVDDALIPPDCRMEVIETRRVEDAPYIAPPAVVADDDPDPAVEDEPDEADAEADASESPSEDGSRRKRRRRRRGRGRSDGEAAETSEATPESAEATAPSSDEPTEAEASDAPADADAEATDEDGKPKRRRRGKRGGRRRRSKAEDGSPAGMEVIDPEAANAAPDAPPEPGTPTEDAGAGEPAGDAVANGAAGEAAPAAQASAAEAVTPEPAPEAPAPAPAPAEDSAVAATTPVDAVPVEAEPAEDDDEDGPPNNVVPADAPAAVATEADPEASERRKRWQDRIKGWLGN